MICNADIITQLTCCTCFHILCWFCSKFASYHQGQSHAFCIAELQGRDMGWAKVSLPVWGALPILRRAPITSAFVKHNQECFCLQASKTVESGSGSFASENVWNMAFNSVVFGAFDSCQELVLDADLVYLGWYPKICHQFYANPMAGHGGMCWDSSQPLSTIPHWPSVLWCCWLGSRKGIRRVKNWVVGCWRGNVTVSRWKFAYGPADANATHYLLLQ